MGRHFAWRICLALCEVSKSPCISPLSPVYKAKLSGEYKRVFHRQFFRWSTILTSAHSQQQCILAKYQLWFQNVMLPWVSREGFPAANSSSKWPAKGTMKIYPGLPVQPEIADQMVGCNKRSFHKGQLEGYTIPMDQYGERYCTHNQDTFAHHWLEDIVQAPHVHRGKHNTW